MASLKINSGIKIIDIEDKNGIVRGQIKINTSDINLVPRAQKLVDEVGEYLNDLENIVETDENRARIIEDVDKKIKAEVDALFDDAECSKVLFGNQNCLNTLNGVTYIERVLTAILPMIKADSEAEKKASDKRIKKYTSQVK